MPTRLSHDDYTVGWICALPLEMAAAEGMLDEVHADLTVASNDHNAYTLGRIGDHNVVIACLPDGEYGISSATTVAVQMQSSFRSIRFGLMVGIGGGIPSEDVDIRLGDVVVSRPTDTHGGVVQYDYGKALAGENFERTGMLNRPPQILLTALAKLRARHMKKGTEILSLLDEMIEKNPRMESTFAHQGWPDLLFLAEYNHAGAAKKCHACDKDKVVPRDPRKSNEPLVHYGLIASANQVVKDSNLRDRIAEKLGAYCVEMEAAGLMNNFPCLVIRGICDYADSHKNKEWQGYAAAVAAAYAKELITVVPRSSTHADHPATVKTTVKMTRDLISSPKEQGTYESPLGDGRATSVNTKTAGWIDDYYESGVEATQSQFSAVRRPLKRETAGCDAVGLLLRHIPLLIDALDYYVERVSMSRSLRKYENALVDSQSYLISSMVMYQESCKKLVEGLPDTKIRDLLYSNRGWDDPEITAELIHQLGKQFGKYISMVKRVYKQLDLIRKKLKLQADLVASFLVYGAIDEVLCQQSFEEWSNISERFNIDKYIDTISEINRGIGQISSLMQDRSSPELPQPGQSSPASFESWLDIRGHTYRLFNAISSIWPRTCLSHVHRVKLSLSTPTEEENDGMVYKIRVSFSTDKSIDKLDTSVWEWRDAIVITSNSFTPQTSKRSVRFSAVKDISSDQTRQICPKKYKIEDLCDITDDSSNSECLGILPCDGRDYHVHNPVMQRRGLVRLRQLLSSQSLTTRQKRTLALTLAFGVLQLYDTPWLHDNWSVDDIYLDTSKGIGQLYVLKTFKLPPEEQTPACTSDDSIFVRNRVLFALGVSLLELTYGAPLSARKTEEDLNDIWTHYRTAFRLAKRIKEDELPRFAQAVFKCIHPDAEGYEYSLGHEGFRRRFIQEVVMPLKEDFDELP